MKIIKKEKWKPLLFYDIESNYMISNKGRIYSKKSNKIIKSSECGEYLKVTLYINKMTVQTYIHRLVAMNFVDISQELLDRGFNAKTLEVNHKNHNKHDNRAKNLEWVTDSENKVYDYNTNNRLKGSKSHLYKGINTPHKIRKVCKLLEKNNMTINEIASTVDVDPSVVYDILYNGSWIHISSKYKISNYTPKNRKYSSDDIELIKKFIDDGKTRKEISEIMDINYKSICYLMNKYILNK